MGHKKIFKSALILGIGAFVAKLLGAIYRVPLTNALTGYGLGLYQMVFPVYSAMLDFSGAGAPSAISKIISGEYKENREDNSQKLLIVSKKFFTVLGLMGGFLMALLSTVFAKGQGDINAKYGYLFIAPAIVFVCIISCYRGYFQGRMQMSPTAISQIIEQAVKISLGLALVFAFMPNIPLAVGGATLAITISEIVAVIYLKSVYKKRTRANLSISVTKSERKNLIKKVLKYLVPITLTGLAIPVSQVIDSFIIVNLLKAYTTNATAQYGLLSGVACTIMNLPVSICYGVATVALPAVSGANSRMEQSKNALKTILITLLVAIPCAIFCYFGAPIIIKILFNKLTAEEKIISKNLLKIISLGIIFLSLLQTTNAVLIGKGKIYLPLISMGIGVCVKIILEVILISNPNIAIYGGAFALIACYFVAVLINLIMIIKHLGRRNASSQFTSRQRDNS